MSHQGQGIAMTKVYRVLAFVVAAGVAVQAAAIAYAVFGLTAWVSAGGTLDKAVLESRGGELGFATHGIFGTMVMPLLALLFLVSSFFARVPGGVRWGLIVFGVTVVQIALGIFSHALPGLGWLHGLTALILFGVAVSAGLRVGRVSQDRVDAQVAAPVH